MSWQPPRDDGTLARTRRLVRLVKHRRVDHTSAVLQLLAAEQYQADLIRRSRRQAGGRTFESDVYKGEVEDLTEAIHDLATVLPGLDDVVWRGRTRTGNLRAWVRRVGNEPVLRRGRVRVEDAYGLFIEGVVAFRGTRRQAMHQARLAQDKAVDQFGGMRAALSMYERLRH